MLRICLFHLSIINLLYMRIEILEGFRDKVIRTVTTRHGGVLLFAGKTDPAVVAAVRDSIPDTVILFYLHPGKADENILASQLSHGRNMTLFSSLEDNEFPHEKAGILLTLKPSQNTCLKADNSIGDKYAEVIAKINEAVSQALSNAEQSRIGGLIYLRSSLCNMKTLFSSPRITIRNSDPSIPAVICCGGPSFADSIPLLKKYQNKIAIFAMARTSGPLLDAGICPDIIVHSDPFYDISWSEKASDKGCVLAASLSVFPPLTSKFRNIIWYTGDTTPVNNYIKNIAPELLNEITVSKTVTVSAIDLAVKAGFKKIALTGSDLCLSQQGRTHADTSAVYEGTPIKIKGSARQEVFTTPEFESLRKGIENYLGSQIPADMTIYNCTPDGAHVENTTHIRLEDFLVQNTNAEKPGFIKTETKHPPAFNLNTIVSDLEKLIRHTDSVILHTEELLQAIQTNQNIEKCRTGLTKTSSEKIQLSNTHLFTGISKDIDNFLENTINRIPELRYIDRDAPLPQLLLLLKRSLLLKDLYCDILAAFACDFQANQPGKYMAFRNYALRFISAGNPGFAEYLEKNVARNGRFKLTFSLQELPHRASLADNGKRLFSYSIFDHHEKASTFADSLEKQYSIDQAKDVIVFPAPIDYMNIVATARKYPAADMMIIEIWPELLNQLISSAMFFHELPEKTIVAGPGDIDGLVASTLAQWKNSGKKILVIETPESKDIEEAAALAEAIRHRI